MDLLDLKAILAIAKLKNFTNAAYEVHLSESSLSKRVARLERDLGNVRLFNRSTRNVSLTSAGEIFLDYAQKILLQIDNMHAEISKATGNNLCLGVLSKLEKIGFLPCLSRFISNNPNITIETLIGNTTELLQLLENNRVDIAFAVTSNYILKRAKDNIYSVVKDEIVLVVNKNAPQAGLPSVSLPDIKDERLISLNSNAGTERIILDVCQEYGFEPKIVHRAAQPDIIVDLICSGVGVGLMAKKVFLACSPDLKMVEMIPLDPPVERITSLLVPYENANNIAVQAFVKHLLNDPFCEF